MATKLSKGYIAGIDCLQILRFPILVKTFFKPEQPTDSPNEQLELELKPDAKRAGRDKGSAPNNSKVI